MEQNQQQPYYDYPIGSNPPSNDSKADLLDKIKPELAIESIKQNLLGKTYNPISQKWEENPGLKQFALTEFGASHISNLIYPASSQNSSLSNLKEDRINKRLVGIMKSLVKSMLDYWDEMGIRSNAQMFHVASIVYTHVWVSLTQAENEGIRRLINSTIQESRSVATYGEERKGGIFSGMFRKK